ncbi:hypothetical protein B0G77_7764 [Paraburkholderia sp. BL10I2N1]|nr:hypothetical protein B0G77_7764 [Paraburkholderia sp. BL10I2N1]
MDEVAVILLAGAAVVTLLPATFIVGVVMFTRRDGAPPSPDLLRLFRIAS